MPAFSLIILGIPFDFLVKILYFDVFHVTILVRLHKS